MLTRLFAGALLLARNRTACRSNRRAPASQLSACRTPRLCPPSVLLRAQSHRRAREHRSRCRSRPLRRASDHAPHEGFRDSFASLASSLRMEWKVFAGRQWRLGRIDRSNSPGRSSPPRVCRGRDRRWPSERWPGAERALGYRPPGKADRFRLSRGSRNQRPGQGHRACLFWPRSGAELFQRLLRWRT